MCEREVRLTDVPVRLRPLRPAELAALLQRIDHPDQPAGPSDDDTRAAVKHFLARLAQQYPGKSVEVRVPPYAAVQCVQGARHTRGTPPAVVEMDAATWLALARGRTTFREAASRGAVRASGERSDLTDQLPLV